MARWCASRPRATKIKGHEVAATKDNPRVHRPQRQVRQDGRAQGERAAQAVSVRRLVLVLGDQLDGESAAFDGFDPARDAILQMEVREEAEYIPQHKRRLAFFFAAMRHFRDEQRAKGRRVHYAELDDPANRGAFADEIRRWADALAPESLVVLEPGDWRVRQTLAGLGLGRSNSAPTGISCVPRTTSPLSPTPTRAWCSRPFIAPCGDASAS